MFLTLFFEWPSISPDGFFRRVEEIYICESKGVVLCDFSSSLYWLRTVLIWKFSDSTVFIPVLNFDLMHTISNL